MEREKREELLRSVQARKQEAARAWYDAISGDCFMPFSAAEVRARLAAWFSQAAELWLAEAWEPERGSRIGQDLAGLHCLHGSVLERTMRVLGDELAAGLEAEALAALYPRLVAVLAAVTDGYFQETSATMLREQEEIRRALVSALQTARQALEEARDQLEVRVKERTAELAVANEELRYEIAERRRVEKDLRASEDRWRTLVQSVPDLVALVDLDGIIRFINHMPEDSTASPERVIGTSVVGYFLPEHREEVERALEKALSKGESAAYEMPAPRADGTFQWRATRVGPVRRDGQIVGALLVSRDVSEKKRLEEMKDNLIRDVSHELRTPLAKVQMSLELLAEIVGREEIDASRALRIGDMATRNVRRLLDTVEGILDLSRLDAGMLALEQQEIDLAALVDEAVTYAAPVAMAKGLELDLDLEPGLPTLQGDREKLFRVLSNLVENSVKFSEKGRIVVSAWFHNGLIHGTVVDEGDGILPENLEHIFDRFFQERPSMSGVGIGLTISKNIVEAHGGRIWAESAGRGQGTTFHFVLPVVPGEEPGGSL